MGVGKMTIPLYVSIIPEGMTLTIDSVVQNTPKGMYTHISKSDSMTFPHTFDPQQVKDGQALNKRGAKVADFVLATDGAFDSGDGGSFTIGFTFNGRATQAPNATFADNIKGTLVVGTSQWGTISRPDQTIFSTTLAAGGNATQTEKTPTLAMLADSVIMLEWNEEKKVYVFGVSNQEDMLEWVLKAGVGGIIAGHKVLYSTAAGWVTAIGGTLVAVACVAGSAIDGI